MILHTRIKSMTIASVLAAVVSTSVALPPAMTDMGFADAVRQNEETQGQFLIVKFTADWCGPCVRMDQTVWSDTNIINYLKQSNVVVIPVDIDEHPDLATEYHIKAVPTMVAFKGGEQVDQIVGGKRSNEVESWIGSLLDGRTESDRINEQMRDKSLMTMNERVSHARDLVRSNMYDQATQEYLWLWDHMLEHERSMYGVRLSFMVGDMQRLAAAYPPAEEAFTALRDRLTEKLENGQRDRENLIDWLTLNIRLLEDDEAVAQWVDRIKDRESGLDTLKSMGTIVQGWLLEQERWETAGLVLAEADKVIERSRSQRRSMDEHAFSMMDESVSARLKSRADLEEIQKNAQIHAAYLAAKRTADAWSIYEALLEDYDHEAVQVAICQAAARAQVIEGRHREIANALDQWSHKTTRSLILNP